MKFLIGILLILIGIALGLYVGLYLCFVGGIMSIYVGLTTTSMGILSWGIIKFCVSGVVGFGLVIFFGAISTLFFDD